MFAVEIEISLAAAGTRSAARVASIVLAVDGIEHLRLADRDLSMRGIAYVRASSALDAEELARREIASALMESGGADRLVGCAVVVDASSVYGGPEWPVTP